MFTRTLKGPLYSPEVVLYELCFVWCETLFYSFEIDNQQACFHYSVSFIFRCYLVNRRFHPRWHTIEKVGAASPWSMVVKNLAPIALLIMGLEPATFWSRPQYALSTLHIQPHPALPSLPPPCHTSPTWERFATHMTEIVTSLSGSVSLPLAYTGMHTHSQSGRMQRGNCSERANRRPWDMPTKSVNRASTPQNPQPFIWARLRRTRSTSGSLISEDQEIFLFPLLTLFCLLGPPLCASHLPSRARKTIPTRKIRCFVDSPSS